MRTCQLDNPQPQPPQPSEDTSGLSTIMTDLNNAIKSLTKSQLELLLRSFLEHSIFEREVRLRIPILFIRFTNLSKQVQESHVEHFQDAVKEHEAKDAAKPKFPHYKATRNPFLPPLHEKNSRRRRKVMFRRRRAQPKSAVSSAAREEQNPVTPAQLVEVPPNFKFFASAVNFKSHPIMSNKGRASVTSTVVCFFKFSIVILHPDVTNTHTCRAGYWEGEGYWKKGFINGDIVEEKIRGWSCCSGTQWEDRGCDSVGAHEFSSLVLCE